MNAQFGSKESAPAQADYSKRRHQSGKDDIELSAEGKALLASIEESARPKQLAAAFPRIVNHMAKVWKIPREMDRYFQDLLTDTPPGLSAQHPDGVDYAQRTLRDQGVSHALRRAQADLILGCTPADLGYFTSPICFATPV